MKNKREKLFFIFKVFFSLLSLTLILPFFSADVISINSGGDNELVITSNTFLEGFFSGGVCLPLTCSQMSYNCGNWDNGCGIILNCGTCGTNYTCSSGVCTLNEGETGGGETGGEETKGEEGKVETEQKIGYLLVSPDSISLTLAYNSVTNMTQRTSKKIYITNTRNITQLVNLTLEGDSGIERIVMLPKQNTFSLAPNETKEINVDFISPLENGRFNAGIIVNGLKRVALNIEVTPNPLWFDSNIVVLNKDYSVSQGGQLRTKVELVPMGDPSRLDVTLKYVIKDYKGKVYLTQSETLLVEKRMSVNRNFGTGKLPLGRYTISLDLIYPGGIAPSSAHFEVVKRTAGDVFGMLLFFLVLAILVVITFIIVLIILKRRKKRQDENQE